MIRALAAGLGLLAALYGAAAAALYLAQRPLLFDPDPRALPPETLGLPGARVRSIAAEAGVSLVAWFLPSERRRLILYLHGTGGSLADRAPRVRELAAHGAVLAIDYRGFGGSTGAPSEAGLTRDAEAAYRHATEAGFAPRDIVVLGESLGSGLALRLAAERPVGGVVLAGAYRSIREIAARRYWMFPVSSGMRDPFDVAADLARVRAPMLVLHGRDDPVIPVEDAERLVAGAGPNVAFAAVAGAGHRVLDDPGAAARLEAWLAALPERDAARAAPQP
ncbi:MAG: alpha/beta fold hydrolase [Methylorubrum rhodinum]|uniref:alpha/beta hydrolase n=1 Tax=Methylorubrum rhodinum TaxID=29428 RepID=UPI003BAE1568